MRRPTGSVCAGLVAAALLAAVAGARADEGCAAFDWSVGREQKWFASKDLPRRPTGARLKRIDRAVQLELKPLRQVTLFLPPAIDPHEGAYAGEIAFFGVPKPGAYVVTTSLPAHVDVFENGMRIKPEAMETAPDCDDARMSARYNLQRGDLVLVQVTDVAADSIKIAFTPAP